MLMKREAKYREKRIGEYGIMSKEVFILIAAWLITILILVRFVPKDKLREALVIFYFQQIITWIFGLLVVEYHLIEYPVRLFSYANRTSFSFEFFIYPGLCILFNLHYPSYKSKLTQFFYFAGYCTAMTFIEVLVVKYTDIANYLHWSGFYTWVTLFITLYVSRRYYLWHFRLKA